MARVATAVFVAVLVAVALLPARAYLTKERDVLASTPSAYTGLTQLIPLRPGQEACVDEILFATNAEVARFGAAVPEDARAPALEVVARGNRDGEFRSDYRSESRVPGGWSGSGDVDVRLDPPERDVFGTFCITNAGTRQVDLVGNDTGRAISRPSLTVDGEPLALELPLRLLEAERSSYLSRAGQIMEQASSLRPLGAWWWWLLALALLTLAPAGVVLAMRSALAGDAALGARERASLEAWPSERVRRRLAAVPGWAILAAAGAIAVAWLLCWGVNTHVFQHDEDQYVYLSRWLQNDFPARLWDFETYGRGLQRLEVWLLAIPSWLFDSPASLVGGRLLNTVAFVSTAIPVYLLGRGMGLRSQWAALPAALSAVVPWAVVTTAFLTENIAYPAYVWVVWSMWRAVAAPSPRRDLLALVLLVVAGLGRSGLLLIAPALPLAVLATGLRCGAGDLPARLRRLLREHVVLWIAVVAAALPLLLAPLGVGIAESITDRLAGGYPTTATLNVSELLTKTGTYFARVVVGTGLLPAALALPWLAGQLVRPRDRASFALAAVVVLAALMLFASLAPAGPDERYIVYLAPLVLLPATLAVARRELSPLGLGIASALLALLLWRVAWNPEQGSFGFFVSPVEMFYSRVLGLRLASYLPGDASEALAFVALAFAAAGIALAVLLRRAPARLAGAPAALLVAAVVALVLVQTNYTLTKYVNGAGSKAAASLGERAFVDRAVPDGATVGLFAEGPGLTPEYTALWQELQFYNQRIETVYTVGDELIPWPPGDAQVGGIGFDPRTGRIESSVPLPEYLAIPAPFRGVRLRGEIIRAPSYIPIALQRVAQPATLAWSTTGFDDAPGGAGPGVVRLYGGGLEAGAHCAAVTLAAPPDRDATWRVRRDGRALRSGTLDPGEQRSVAVDLPQLVEHGHVDVAIAGKRVGVLSVAVDEGC